MNALEVAVALAVITAGGWALRRIWSQVLRVQARSADKLIVETWQQYFNGHVALEPAAQELARLWQEKASISGRLSVTSVGRPESQEEIQFPLPPDVDANDPRLDPLGERASAIFAERTVRYLDKPKHRRSRIG